MFEEMGPKLYDMGVAAVARKDISGALSLFEKSLGFMPEHADCLNAAGLCCFELGDFGKAVFYWKRSLQTGMDGNPAARYLEYADGSVFKAYVSRYNTLLDQICRREYIRALIGTRTLGKCHVPLELINIRGLLFHALGLKRIAVKQWRIVLAKDSSNRDAADYILKSGAGGAAV